jgi:hypothetical protein
MAKRKDNFFHAGGVRRSVSNRKSKIARPWNHPDVVKASESYGVPFNSYKQVHAYENTIQDNGALEDSERFTCRKCSKLMSEHEDHAPEQLDLFKEN